MSALPFGAALFCGGGRHLTTVIRAVHDVVANEGLDVDEFENDGQASMILGHSARGSTC